MAPSTVWTNVEDEILKASISKYGMNQWARVSSLLARKSAKQCKARWQEYLDPGIRKTEWSKDEDERLLHLVKIFSTQWRTISTSLQGRSANQCLQRYQQILDEAEKRESDDFGLAGVTTGEAAPTADDVRKLRPGEVDPDPETKPAKPDAVDMDEEEKEMLSEARARLANTQGKKAKRKARERLLEESRRTAQLQKRRELKMSGINIKIRTTKKGEMDYNADVPFEHNVPRGFYDVDEERERNEQEKAAFDPKKQQLANKRKGDQDDEGEDRKRKKTDKNASAGPSISAQAMKAAQLQKIREAERSSKRVALNLPAPQVNEGELEEVIKMGMAGERASRGAITGENDATRGLIGNYNNMVGTTPIRTPRAAPEEDRIANELRNIRAMQGNQSALLGEETEDLIEGPGSTGFGGIQPSKQQLVTPNPMATPFRQANGIGATPGRGPGATPRDTLNLNAQNGLVPVGQTPREVRQYEQGKRSSILAKLAALPGPKKISLELELPEEQEVTERNQSNAREDASIRDTREKRIRDAAELAEFRRQTYVVQQRLPRPALVDIDALMKNAEDVSDPIEREVAIQSALLIANDAAKFGGSKISGSTKPLQGFDDGLMRKARDMVASEMASDDAQEEKAAFRSAWTELHSASKLPGLDGYYEDEVDEHQMMVEQFDNIEDKITSYAEKGNELEKKLAKLHGGYQNRAKMLREKINEAADVLEKTKIGLNTALNAQVGEDAAISRRLEGLRDEVTFVSKREREAQEEYRKVKDELDSLVTANGYH